MLWHYQWVAEIPNRNVSTCAPGGTYRHVHTSVCSDLKVWTTLESKNKTGKINCGLLSQWDTIPQKSADSSYKGPDIIVGGLGFLSHVVSHCHNYSAQPLYYQHTICHRRSCGRYLANLYSTAMKMNQRHKVNFTSIMMSERRQKYRLHDSTDIQLKTLAKLNYRVRGCVLGW